MGTSKFKERHSVPSRFGEEEVRQIVERMLDTQLTPIKEELKKQGVVLDNLDRWQLQFYSNGRGKIPGLFQRRIEIDDQRNRAIWGELTKQSASAKKMDAFIDQQEKYKDWVKFAWAKLRPILKWLGGIIGTGILGFGVWIGPKIPKIIHAGIVIWEDYEKSHPAVTERLKDVGSEESPAYTGAKNPPDTSHTDKNRAY